MWVFESNLSKGKCKNNMYLSQLKNEYECYKNEPINELLYSDFVKTMETGNRLTYENKYFKRRRILRDFALVSWIYDDTIAIEKLENIMWAVCNEFTWVLPAHIGDSVFDDTIDLFSAETAQTLAEIISLLKNRLSDIVVKRCIDEINRRVLIPFVNRTKPYNWESMKSNWCAVCGGCIGMTAIYIVEDDKKLINITDSLKSVMKRYMDSFTDDGACLEGLYYWNYGMMYFTAFLDLYKQRTNKDFFVNIDKIRKMADFPNKCCIGNGYTISFSDGYEKDKIYLGLSYKLNEMYGTAVADSLYTAEFVGDDCGRWCKSVRDIAWTGKNNNKSQTENSVFPFAQWAVLHDENMSVAFKGGNNDEPHNHNDIGNIIIRKNNKIIFADIGAGEYTKEYFSDKRYNVFCNRSISHSVPIINGAEQKTGVEFSAKDFLYEKNSVSADISGAYGIIELTSCVRTVECKNGVVEIKDCFCVDGELTVTERFITRHGAEKENGLVKIFSDSKCIAEIETQNKCDIEINGHKHHEHDGTVSNITSIDFIFTVKGKNNFLVKVL